VGKTPLLQQPVQPDNADKWRTRMTCPQIRIFESAAGDTLARFGYPLRRAPKECHCRQRCIPRPQLVRHQYSSKDPSTDPATKMKLTIAICTHNRGELLAAHAGPTEPGCPTA
jgi:hypothetical protein